MKEVKTNSIQIEHREEKVDTNIFRKKTNSKTFKGWLIGKIKQAKNETNLEVLFMMSEIYKKYCEFETKEINLKNWKGKSSINIFVKPNTFIVSTWQKEDQDHEPKEIKTEITKQEVNLIINTLSKLEEGKTIPTRDIGEDAYKMPWDDIFSNRPLHTHLNLILRILDHYEIIKYRGGKSTILNKVKEIQEKLK